MEIDKSLLERVGEHTPVLLTGVGIAGMLANIYRSVNYSNIGRELKWVSYRARYENIKIEQGRHSNNWLKRHGYPMKRKPSKKRKGF